MAGKKRDRAPGAAARGVVAKIEADPEATAVHAQLIHELRGAELVELLTDLIPAAYSTRCSEDGDWEEPDVNRALVNAFRTAFEKTDDAGRQAAMANYAKLLRSGNMSQRIAYEEAFVRGSDLEYLGSAEQRFVTVHLIQRLATPPRNSLWDLADGLGPYLKVTEVEPYLSAHLDELLAGNCSDEYAVEIERSITNAVAAFRGEHRQAAARVAKEWRSRWQQAERPLVGALEALATDKEPSPPR